MTSYPIETLLARTECQSYREFARLSNIDVSSVARAARAGLTAAQADRFAVAVGLHPGSVWPAWWDEASAVFDLIRSEMAS